MTYQDALDWMFSKLPMYQRQGTTAFKKDLSNTLKLAEYLNFPHKKFKTVHVAGTNGKGSTSHMVASVLQEAGYKVGLYTSPHLKDFRERIKINGKTPSKAFVADFIVKHKAFLETNSLSFFEMTVAMAFQYFAQQDVDISVVEVGLGGRLDSTNIIMPEVSVITNIGFDHTQFLGNTLQAIAFEKGGVIKPEKPVVVGETHKETETVFKKLADKNNAKIIFADQEKTNNYPSDLKGSYQNKNIKTAQITIQVLRKKGFDITEMHIKKGFLNVVKNTGLLGRWQVLSKNPKVVCDTGHNRDGLSYVMQQISTEPFNKLHIVFGVVNDKDIALIADLLPKRATYYFCKPDIPRGLDAKCLKETLLSYGVKGETYRSVADAYKEALKQADKDDFVFIGGSTFVVAEII
ncbi:MAG: bifunctional folylpolyglutamate synthase/dihydrofolate synthase [Aestuariibaculum sp.]